jgi:hypothetical protein
MKNTIAAYESRGPKLQQLKKLVDKLLHEGD